MSAMIEDQEAPILAHDPSKSKGLRSPTSDTIKTIETFLVKPSTIPEAGEAVLGK